MQLTRHGDRWHLSPDDGQAELMTVDEARAFVGVVLAGIGLGAAATFAVGPNGRWVTDLLSGPDNPGHSPHGLHVKAVCGHEWRRCVVVRAAECRGGARVRGGPGCGGGRGGRVGGGQAGWVRADQQTEGVRVTQPLLADVLLGLVVVALFVVVLACVEFKPRRR